MKNLTESRTGRMMHRTERFRYVLLAEGIAVGAAAGVLAILYRFLLDRAEHLMRALLLRCTETPWAVTLWFLLLCLLAPAVGWLIRREPMISGSGIPQVSGEVRGLLDPNWLRVIAAKIAGGTMCILGGLSLGREGPSVQLGAMAGKGVSRLLHRRRSEERYLITCGAGAGLAAAFNAPLAGIMFSLEEVHKNFSPAAIISVMAAAITGDFISKNVFGLSTVFSFPLQGALPLHHYWLLLPLGILLGVLGAFYNTANLAAQDLYVRMRRIPPQYRIFLPFLVSGVLGLLLPQVLGGGHVMIDLLIHDTPALGMVLLLLTVKFLFSLFCFGSGAPGGIFFPLLVLGSYIGAAFGLVAVQHLGLDPALLNNIIIAAMAGYFTAIVRAPITGIILIAEMTGSFSHLLSLAVVSMVAYCVASLLGSKPIYESLLSRILRKQGICESQVAETALIESVVEQGSDAEGQTIADLRWPKDCLIVAIRRGGEEMIPAGNTLLMAGDTLVALCDEEEHPFVQSQLAVRCRSKL